MATSGLLCVNIKTRERSDEEGGEKSTAAPAQQPAAREEPSIASSPNARLLIQALIDNGIINASNKATIRIIDNSKREHEPKTIVIPSGNKELSEFKALNLGSFVVKQARSSSDHHQSSSRHHHQRAKQEVVVQEDAKGRKYVVQNQNNAGSFVRIQNQNQIVLDNTSGVVQNAQGNLVFPIISGSNLIRLSDGSLVIPVQRVESHKKESDSKQKREELKTSDDNSFASLVFQDRNSSIMESEPPPLLILPTDDNQQSKTTQNSDGEPIKLPENLESLPKAEHFPTQRHRWNTNEEIAAILISFERHADWQSKEVKIRPKSGSMLLYSRKKVRYRRDGYCWKKRKDGKTTREDHMKLKVQGTEF